MLKRHKGAGYHGDRTGSGQLSGAPGLGGAEDLQLRLGPAAFKGLQSVAAGCCENHSVGVFDLSHRTVMAAGYQTPKHNRRTDGEPSQEPRG